MFIFTLARNQLPYHCNYKDKMTVNVLILMTFCQV